MKPDELLKRSIEVLDTKRTPMFNTYHPGIKFGAPGDGKPAWEIREPLLPGTPMRFYKVCKSK